MTRAQVAASRNANNVNGDVDSNVNYNHHREIGSEDNVNLTFNEHNVNIEPNTKMDKPREQEI